MVDAALLKQASEIVDYGVETVAFAFFISTCRDQLSKLENSLLKSRAVEVPRDHDTVQPKASRIFGRGCGRGRAWSEEVGTDMVPTGVVGGTWKIQLRSGTLSGTTMGLGCKVM
jgi:hypothetical protein